MRQKLKFLLNPNYALGLRQSAKNLGTILSRAPQTYRRGYALRRSEQNCPQASSPLCSHPNAQSGFKFFSLYLISILLLSSCGGKFPLAEKSAAPAVQESEVSVPIRVGFDVDDTLLFSTPAFEKGYQSGTQPYSPEFWGVVNSSDREYSVVKKKAQGVVLDHLKKGDEVYVITAREPVNAENLKNCLNEKFGIKKENVFFAPKGKADLIKELGISVYYGDSDSDIEDAQKAGIKAVRIMRSEKSSYKSKYNPGSFGEEVISNSAE